MKDICNECDGFIYNYCEECPFEKGCKKNNMKALISQLNELEKDERKRADQTHGDRFSSNHEAYAVILEEVEEADFEESIFKDNFRSVWWNIKNDIEPKHNWTHLHGVALRCCAEWLQVATMCKKAKESEEER